MKRQLSRNQVLIIMFTAILITSIPLIYYFYTGATVTIITPNLTDYERFINDLNNEVSVSASGSISQPFIPVNGTLLNADGEQLQVYQFANESVVNDFINNIGSASINWTTPHLFNQSSLLIIYLGNATSTLSILNSLTGPQAAGVLGKFFCTPDSREVDACIELYQPVCGYLFNSSSYTYPNSCFACMDEDVWYYTEGECQVNKTEPGTPPPQPAGDNLGVNLDGADDLSNTSGELLTITKDKIFDLTADESRVYFYTCTYAGLANGYESDLLSIYHVSQTSKELTRLIEMNVSLCGDYELLSDDLSLFLISGELDNYEIFKINKLNASLTRLLSSNQPISGLALDDNNVYFLELGRLIKRVNKNGGVIETLIEVNESYFISAFDIDSDNTYYAYSNGEEGVNQSIIGVFNPLSAASVAGSELLAVNGEVFQIKGSTIYQDDEVIVDSATHDYFRNIYYRNGLYYSADPSSLKNGALYHYNLTSDETTLKVASIAPGYSSAPKAAFSDGLLYYADLKYVNDPVSANYNKTLYYVAYLEI